MLETLQLFALAVAVVAAAWTDLRWRRIPNRITVAALLAGAGLAAAVGPGALLSGSLAAGLTFAVGLALFAAGVLGGGDVKLATAAAMFLGLERLPEAVMLAALAGGVLAVTEAVRRGILIPVLLDSRDVVVSWVTAGRSGQAHSLSSAGRVSVPYGVAIALGAVGAWVL